MGLFRRFDALVLAGTLLVFTYPLFFMVLRISLFRTVPYDDYAPYLMFLMSKDGALPVVPYAYRILSVLAAVPFYYIMPPIDLYMLPEGMHSVTYIKATEAIVAQSCLSIVGTMVLVYLICQRRLGCSRGASLMVSLASFFQFFFICLNCMDALALFYATLLIYIMRRKLAFSVLMVTGVLLNEKLAFFFICFYGLKLIADFRGTMKEHGMQAFAAFASPVLYALVWFLAPLSVATYYVETSSSLPSLMETLPYFISAKGMALNTVPVVLLLALAILPRFIVEREKLPFLYHRNIFLLPLAIVVLVTLMDVQYNVGRVAMYSVPFLIPVWAVVADSLLSRRENSTVQAA